MEDETQFVGGGKMKERNTYKTQIDQIILKRCVVHHGATYLIQCTTKRA